MAGSAFHDWRNFYNFAYDLPVLRIALDVDYCCHRLGERLCNLHIRHASCIRMSLHHLQEARPDVLGTGGVDNESRMPVPGGGGGGTAASIPRVKEKCMSRPSRAWVPIQTGEQQAARLEVVYGALGDVVQALAGQAAGAQTKFDNPSGSFSFLKARTLPKDAGHECGLESRFPQRKFQLGGIHRGIR